MLDYFQCRGVLLEQGPAVLAVGVGGRLLGHFFFSVLSTSVGRRLDKD